MKRNDRYSSIVDEEVIEILKKGFIKGNVYYLPSIKLERNLYEKVNKVLLAMGAKWNRKEQGHIFEYDIASMLQYVIKEKKVTDWKKNTDFFFTPKEVVYTMLGLVQFYKFEKFNVLEPSCGQGHILDLLKEEFPNAQITCIEQNPLHCEKLREKGYSPIQQDFLKTKVEQTMDVILMNPPFSDEDNHIQHAYEFLKEDGIMISIASAMVLDRENKKGQAFKKWFQEVNGYDYKLPANSFKDSGTGVNTKMLVFMK